MFVHILYLSVNMITPEPLEISNYNVQNMVPFELTLSLWRFSWYLYFPISGSQAWPFWVTWRHHHDSCPPTVRHFEHFTYLLTYLHIYLLTESPVWKIRLITASLHHHIHISTFITSHILSVYQHDNSWIRYRYHLTTMFKTWFLSKSPSIFNGFQDICIFLYLGHDLDLFGSHHILLLFDISNTSRF